MRFCKFHGFGNDYLVLASEDLRRVESLADFARQICERHTGVGADGIAVWEKSNDTAADFLVRIFNPDGSEAAFSGNGTRCAAAFLHYKQIWTDQELRLRTKSGIKNYRLIETESTGSYRFEAELGKPKFDAFSIPMTNEKNLERVIDLPLQAGGKIFSISAVNVGNPVVCVFVEDFDDFDWRKVGREIETHPFFPERANAVFVRVLDRENIELRIWERGAGETPASGTCSIGAAVLTVVRGETRRRVTVHSPGGAARVFWREDDEILLTGRADLAFCGEWHEPN